MIPEWGGCGSFAIDRVRARIKVRMERAEDGPWRRCITAPRKKEKQMTNLVIPAEAVEAAYDKFHHLDITTADIEGILEAAAPHMLAEAWEEGRQAEEDAPPLHRTTPNPYRSQA